MTYMSNELSDADHAVGTVEREAVGDTLAHLDQVLGEGEAWKLPDKYS